jgi:drug/metabolite transporter (DMT)-like permease
MWITLALLAAIFSAATTLMLKRSVGEGGAVLSTVAFRGIAGLMLAAAVTIMAPWPPLPFEFWRTLAFVIPPEIGGMLFLTLALREGEVSVVQPIMGLLPLLVMAGGVLFLHEVPSPLAVVGIVFVAAGLYFVGLRQGESLLEPIRALATSRASWYAVLATLFWTVTSLLHKVGIAIVGPMPWAATLTLFSGLGLAAALPLVAWKTGSIGAPARVVPWMRLVALTGVCYAIQQVGLQNAMGLAQAGYVIAVASLSILMATALGVLWLREEGGAYRIVGALLVSVGAGLIALFG